MPQCTARSKQTGKRCGQTAISGSNVCRHHGGGAPQVKAAAEARLRALVDPSLGVLEYALRQKGSKLRDAIVSARDLLDRAGLGAVHKVEDVTPAERLTSEERLTRIRQLAAELIEPKTDAVQ